jgi:hypothetical protein
MIERALETSGFSEEMTKISRSLKGKARAAVMRALASLRKRKGGIAGAGASYLATMGLAPLLGYGAGSLLAPGSLQKSREEVKKPESVILHSIMPGYSEYLYGRKARAREKLREHTRKRNPEKK